MSIDLNRLIQTFGTIHTNYQIDKLMRLNYVMFVFHSIHCKVNKINVSMFCIITHTSGRIWIGQIFLKMKKFKKKYFKHLHNGVNKFKNINFISEMKCILDCSVLIKNKRMFSVFSLCHTSNVQKL